MGKFSPVKKQQSLSKHVESEIEAAIRSRRFIPGSKLPSENVLCTQFGVSRTAIREAIRMLNARGMVEVFKGRGVFVSHVSASSVTEPLSLYLELTSERHHVLHVVHARQIIEPPIAASAAQYHTEEDAARLLKDIEDLRTCDGDFAELAALDMRFHLNIARSSENPIIPLILEPIHRLLPQIKSTIYASVDDAKDSALIWHQKIIDRILARDSEGAREAMTNHLIIAEEHARKMLDSTTGQKDKI